MRILLIVLAAVTLLSCSRQDSARTFASKAAIALADGNSKAAMGFANRAVELRPDVPEYWAGLGMAQVLDEKKEDAVASYSRALDLLKAERVQRPLDQVMILVLLGREEEAKDLFEVNSDRIFGSQPKSSFGEMFESQDTRYRIR